MMGGCMESLNRFLLKELLEIAKEMEIEHKSNIKKSSLIALIEECAEKQADTIIAWGTLEIMNDGYGFLRETSAERDIYVSVTQIRRFKMRKGDFVVGLVRPTTEKSYALKKVLMINNKSLDVAESRIPFEDLTPAYPTKKYKLETERDDYSSRIIDLVAPIGMGQRALIIAPPKAGKTMLITSIANSIIENYPNTKVWILLIDERPEEVTDIRENVEKARVIASTFDEDPHNHIKVTEEIIKEAKKEVEDGNNIVILLDSLTRLARAYNIVIPSSGKLLSGGIDPSALYYPKNFFGTARNIRGGGSLTIIATVLVDTGSKMDDIIYEEFKSTGNCDIVLDRNLAELRIFPAIDIERSGTRKEELLLTKQELKSIWDIRRYLHNFDKVERMRKLLDTLKVTPNNTAMLNEFRGRE